MSADVPSSAGIPTYHHPHHPHHQGHSDHLHHAGVEPAFRKKSTSVFTSPPISAGFQQQRASSPDSRPSTASSTAAPPTNSTLSDRPGSRESSYASLSTPASTTSSSFPSNNSNATTTSTMSLTAKSSGMSSPASTSEQCFTPATSTATTSPSSAPHVLGVSSGLEALAQKGKLHQFSLARGQSFDQDEHHGGEGFGAIGSGEGRMSDGSSAGGEALWMRRQKAFEEGKRVSQLSVVGSHQYPHQQQIDTQSPWGPKLDTSVSSLATERDHSSASSSSSATIPPVSRSAWGPGSGLTLPTGLLDNGDARPWGQSLHVQQDNHVSSGVQSISSTAASSPQQRWLAMGGNGGGDGMEKGDGSLGLSIHSTFANFPSSSGPNVKKATSPTSYLNGAPPALMTTPSSPVNAHGGSHHSAAGSRGMDVKSHLDSLKFALQNYDAASERARASGGDGSTFNRTTSFSNNTSQQGLGFEQVYAPGTRRGFVGLAIGNGVRSDGVWSASVSPSMNIQALPPTNSAAAAAFGAGGGTTPVPGASQRGGAAGPGTLLSLNATTGSSSSSSSTSVGLDGVAISRPRSAAAATSNGAMGGGVSAQAQLDQFLASANFLERLAASKRGCGGGGDGSGAVSPAERLGGLSQNELALAAHQHHQDSLAAAAAAAVSALSLSSLGHNYEQHGRGSGALGLTTATGGGGPGVAPGRLALFTNGIQDSPAMSAPVSAFGSPVTFHAPLMQAGDSQGHGGPSPNNRKLNLYKTELCRNWEEKGTCRYGVKCQYAHGDAELRHVQRHSKYKTEICRTFWRTGSCPYAKRCCFIHTTATDTTGMEFASPSLGSNAPLLARVSGDRQSQHGYLIERGGAHMSMPNSPLVSMSRGLTGGSAGVKPFTSRTNEGGYANGNGAENGNGKKPDPLALSSLSDALAGFNLGGPGPISAIQPELNSSSRFRHQSSASMGGSGSMGPSFSGSSHLGHGHGHGLLGSSALGGGPRFFKGPVQ
ncbi:unnamed protein product [Tilletia laevis]|uniref:C3H1-type domain-containing protein n=2 Tax=Tilletia TaxID=13289 RepID=A0A177U2S4_9BASI|nr:hypothetical protein CF335_g6190 [Tilletia laevis]KAE8252671.1 hypothetical protein A4X03_0g6103 [Tilletia caries]CAD6898127.1 unnamed protein product [Tilletia controversa]CAD6891423.1 unnamed protein product [Tilletia caries]CAD6898320.1 unnamed protein product [Tilletia laevis]